MTTSSTRSCPRTRSRPPQSGSSSPQPEHQCGDRRVRRGARRKPLATHLADALGTATVMTDEVQFTKPKTSTRERDDIADRLAEWLRGVTGADELPVVSGLDAPDKGGLSSDTLLADLSWTAGGHRHARRVAVRLPPPVDAWP